MLRIVRLNKDLEIKSKNHGYRWSKAKIFKKDNDYICTIPSGIRESFAKPICGESEEQVVKGTFKHLRKGRNNVLRIVD